MNIGFHPCYNLQTLVYSFYRHYLLKYFLFENILKYYFLKFIIKYQNNKKTQKNFKFF
jgi:hypothetical protein